MEELYELAIKIATCVWNDDEARSAAGPAMLKAVAAYDPSRGVPLEGFVSFCVRRAAQDALRRRNKYFVQLEPFFWNCLDDVSTGIPAEYPLLVEHYMKRVPITTLAEQRGESKRQCWNNLCEEWQRFRKENEL